MENRKMENRNRNTVPQINWITMSMGKFGENAKNSLVEPRKMEIKLTHFKLVERGLEGRGWKREGKRTMQ